MQLSPRSPFALTALAALGLAATRPAAAQGLDGTSVTGSLMFNGFTLKAFDPANSSVPPGFENTAGPAVTEPLVEFGFQDFANLDTADFRDGQLILTNVSTSAGAAPAICTFAGPAFSTVTKVFDDFGAGFTYSLVGDTPTINTPLDFNPDTREAIFNITANAVPEASTTLSFGLLLALGGLTVAAKRRKIGA